MPALAPWQESLSHDACDALLAAYTAYLHQRGLTESLGHPEEGQIVLPREGLASPL